MSYGNPEGEIAGQVLKDILDRSSRAREMALNLLKQSTEQKSIEGLTPGLLLVITDLLDIQNQLLFTIALADINSIQRRR